MDKPLRSAGSDDRGTSDIVPGNGTSDILPGHVTAVIFDMDGTLIDSMPYWRSLASDYLQSLGIEPPDELAETILTMTVKESACRFVEQYSLPWTSDELVAQMLAHLAVQYRTSIPLKAGASEFLRVLQASGRRLAVATATEERIARECLDRLGILGRFEFVLSCETIGVGKSRPDIYRLAAAQLGAAPENTAVYEDALYAARTARAAGFYTVGVFDDSAAAEAESLRAICDEYIMDFPSVLRRVAL